MKKLYKHLLGGNEGALGLALLAPVTCRDSAGLAGYLPTEPGRENILGYAFVAVGLVMLWGNAGVLSLGQGIFFGLGGYCMAMFLKLEASDPISTKIQSTPGIPDFMDWNQITHLPAFWVPFQELSLYYICRDRTAGLLLAYVLGSAMFKRRVGGVYFAVMTQAVALIVSLGIDGNQGVDRWP